MKFKLFREEMQAKLQSMKQTMVPPKLVQNYEMQLFPIEFTFPKKCYLLKK